MPSKGAADSSDIDWRAELRQELRNEADAQNADFMARGQFDPDCWFRIPEFGVLPKDVWFEGFAFPILYPKNPRLTEPMRGLVRNARDLLRRDGIETMAALHKYHLEFLDASDPDPQTGEMPAFKASVKQSAAWCYSTIIFDLERIGRVRNSQQRDTELVDLAFSADLLATWAITGASSTAARIRAGAARGGKRSAETRRAAAVDPDEVVRVAKSLGWPAITQGVNKRLAARFDRTPERIGQILALASRQNPK